MKNTQKWIVSMIICSLLSLSFMSPVHADWTNVAYQKSNSEYIAKGVKHEQILKFTEKGWLNINVLRADLNERDNSLQLLTHENGVGTRGRLSELVRQNENVIGAINGDFFSMATPETLGPMVKNGELLTTPFFVPERMATFNISGSGNHFIDYWTTPQLDFNNKSRPALLKFMAINKNSGSTDTAILFNSAWGERTPNAPRNSSALEVIVENGQIREMITTTNGSDIPKNGYIIWATGSFAEHLRTNFSAGDEVELSIATTPDFNDLALTLGGGAAIVQNGSVPSTFTHNIAGNHPRTAIGITKNNREVFFVTIDGRTSSFTGVSQRELGEIMISLGAYEAINLDGGGSTQMILRPQGDTSRQIVNNLSGGSERSLMNGIGIVNTSPKTDSIGGINLKTFDNSVFVNTTRPITLTAYDRNFNPMVVNYADVKWSVTGIRGSFAGNLFKPSTAGKGNITAKYKGATATMEVRALGSPTALTLNPSRLIMETNSRRRIEALGIDSEGYKAVIDTRDLKFQIPRNLGNVDATGNFISSSQSGAGIINVSLGKLAASLPIAIGTKENIVDGFESLNASFLAFPAEVTGSYELASTSRSGKSSGKLSFDFTATDATRAAYIVFQNGGLHFAQRPSRLGMWVYGEESGNHWIRAKIVGSDGTAHALDLSSAIDWTGWKFLEATVPATLQAPLKLERIYVVETDPAIKSKGSIYIDDLTAFYPAPIPELSAPTKLTDVREVKAELNGDQAFRFTAHGAVTNIDTLLDNLAVQKLAQIANNETSVSVFAGVLDSSAKNQLETTLIQANGGHRATQHKDSLFIQLDNTKGGLRETSFAQWSWFINTLENTDARNVFVILPNAFSFTDKLEEKLFKDTLKKLKETKSADVWVLHGGQTDFDVVLDEGIRYVGLKDYPQHSDIDVFNQLKYMMFTVNENQVTYEILPLFTK